MSDEPSMSGGQEGERVNETKRLSLPNGPFPGRAVVPQVGAWSVPYQEQGGEGEEMEWPVGQAVLNPFKNISLLFGCRAFFVVRRIFRCSARL